MTLAALTAMPVAAHAQNYTITDVGVIGTGNESFAYAINDVGQVAGWSRITSGGNRHAFRWTSGTMLDLGTLGGNESFAYGINDSGHVVGRSMTSGATGDRAFLYNGALVDLSTQGLSTTSQAWGINNAGQIVGRTLSGAATRAFRISGGVATIIPGTFFNNGNSYAYGINEAGHVVGYASTNNQANQQRAFYWPGTGNIQDLSTLGGTDSYGYDINVNLNVVGAGDTSNDAQTNAFRWVSNPMTNMGTLGGIEAEAWGINNSGTIVGYSSYQPGTSSSNGPLHAFVIKGSTMFDMNALIDPASGWVLTDARDINNLGQIVGKGTINGQQHAFIATPTPQWTNAAGGTWSTSSNWSPTAVPSGIARFDLQSVSGYTVTLAAPASVTHLYVQTDKPSINLNNQTLAVSTTLCVGQAPGESGQLSLTSGAVNAGNVYIGGSATAAGGTGVVNINAGATLSATGTLKVWDTGSSQLTINGGTLAVGALDLDNNTSHLYGNGSTTGWVAGTIEITNSNPVVGPFGAFGPAPAMAANRILRIRSSSQYMLLNDGATFNFSGGRVDLTNRKMIATEGDLGSWTGGNYTGITGMIKAGRNGGNWIGSGIVTSEPLAQSQITGLAVATAQQTGKTTFGGASVSGNDVLVMYTYVGDANLSGHVDGDDFARIDTGFAGNLKGYFNGDFNYSGRVDADDYWLIDLAYLKQGTPISAGEIVDSMTVTAVPEPGTLTPLAIAGLSVLRRRARR